MKKVSEFMQKDPIQLSHKRPIRDAVRHIYNFGIGAVLITKDKKLVGIITEEDILHKLFPSIRDFMDDYAHASSINFIEDKLTEVLDRPVSKMMTSKVKSVKRNTPIMRALSTMLVNKFSHLPVIDDNRELIGIISQGDIFRALTSGEVSIDSSQQFYSWLSYYFDSFASGMGRYEIEVDGIDTMLKKHNVKSILNIGNGTGSHDLLLGEKGYFVHGVEKSKRMHLKAVAKHNKSSATVKENVQFFRARSYIDFAEERKHVYDAVIILGSALLHIDSDHIRVLDSAIDTLKPTNSTMIIQISNLIKGLKYNNRFRSFTLTKSESYNHKELCFTDFYDPPKVKGGNCTKTMSILANSGNRWRSIGVNSTEIANLTYISLSNHLKKHGFKKIDIYGSKFGKPIFDHKIKEKEDDWVTIVAIR